MNNSSIVCVDASLIIRLVISGTDPFHLQWKSWSDQNYRLVAPSLLYYEVVNGLYKYEKTNVLPTIAVDKALTAALAFPIELFGDPWLHRRAKVLAKTYSLPAVYDAHYLALSEQMDIELWTADARLYKALQPFGITRVKLAGADGAG
jgi:predicted nucleic acid-binding protein